MGPVWVDANRETELAGAHGPAHLEIAIWTVAIVLPCASGARGPLWRAGTRDSGFPWGPGAYSLSLRAAERTVWRSFYEGRHRASRQDFGSWTPEGWSAEEAASSSSSSSSSSSLQQRKRQLLQEEGWGRWGRKGSAMDTVGAITSASSLSSGGDAASYPSILHNYPLFSAILAFTIAQSTKIFTTRYVHALSKPTISMLRFDWSSSLCFSSFFVHRRGSVPALLRHGLFYIFLVLSCLSSHPLFISTVVRCLPWCLVKRQLWF